jgi:hypothetical protein
MINCRSTFERCTSLELQATIKAQGLDPWVVWNREYASATRRYAETGWPVRVTYEGVYWFEYDELDGEPYGDASMRELRDYRRGLL